jgi:5-deoxy-glucuronate isomerase
MGIHLNPEYIQGAVKLAIENVAYGTSVSIGDKSLEHVIVILEGSCSARFLDDDTAWEELGSRGSVFDGSATAIFAPRGFICVLTAKKDGLKIAIASAAALNTQKPYAVMPDEVEIQKRGFGAWQRLVHDIVGPRQTADRIIIGETFSSGAGVWSGYPPHKHDNSDPPFETKLDEVFYIAVQPKTGFGILLHYDDTSKRESATVVRDGDIVVIDSGYHSFVSAAGHQFYYLWALAGEERMLLPRTDPRHAWLSSDAVAKDQ